MTFCIVIYIYIIYIFFITQIHNYSRNTFVCTVLDSTCVGLRVILCVLPSISLFISVFIKYHNFWAKLRYINIFRKNYLKHVVKNNYIIKLFSPHNILDISNSEQGRVGACGSDRPTVRLNCAILCLFFCFFFPLTQTIPLHSGDGFDTKWPPGGSETMEGGVWHRVNDQMLCGGEAAPCGETSRKTRVASETKRRESWRGWNERWASGVGDPADAFDSRECLASLLRVPARAGIHHNIWSPSTDRQLPRLLSTLPQITLPRAPGIKCRPLISEKILHAPLGAEAAGESLVSRCCCCCCCSAKRFESLPEIKYKNISNLALKSLRRRSDLSWLSERWKSDHRLACEK